MADSLDPNLQAAQPSTVLPSSDTGDSGSAFVIPHNGSSTLGSNQRVQVGEETIQIAPHPTTNRFPWAPVGNPTIPVYKTINTPDEPTVMTPPPATPVTSDESQQVPVQPTPPPAIVQPAPPVLQPEPAPAPPPPPPPVQVVTPQMPSLPLPPPIPLVPQHQAAPPSPVEQFAPPTPLGYDSDPLPPAPDLSVSHREDTGEPIHIYSESTRQVWRMNKGGHGVKIFWIIMTIVIVAGGILFWARGGTLNTILNLPFLQPIIRAQ